MYDTEKRVELVKKRVLEKYRWKKRRGIYRLSALCIALFAFLVGTVHTAAGQTQITARGMYGSILLHEDAGGYVLVGGNFFRHGSHDHCAVYQTPGKRTPRTRHGKRKHITTMGGK